MTVFFSILIFLVVLVVLILVHEWGHFIAAKKTGMRVDEFGIGFPPTICSRQVGETKYSLNALPIGGYVKIFGEDGSEGEESAVDRACAFGARPYWAQAIVLIAGVFMNVVLAFVLLVTVALIGGPTAIDESERTDSAVLQVAGVLSDSPASVLPPRAVITNVVTTEGEILSDLLPSAFTTFVTERPNSEFAITYLANNQEATVLLSPQSGLIPDDPDRVVLGVQLVLTDTVQYSLGGALLRGFEQTVHLLKAIVVGVVTFFAGLLTGGANLADVAGPVGIVSYVGEAASFGFSALLFFTAVISLNLAIINLLPIPALDGGRLIFVAIEALIRRPINPLWAARVNTIGFLFLIGVMVLVTISDIGKFF